MVEKIVLFLCGAIADFFAFMLMARFLMQAFRASFANPLGETVVALTNWAVRPLRRLIPGVMGLDFASFVPAWLLQAGLVMATFMLRLGEVPAGAIGNLIPAALASGAIDAIRIGIYVMIVALIAVAILSWVNPYSPMAAPVAQLVRPLLRPIQRFVPPLSRIDLSPLVAILLLQVLVMVLDGMRGGVVRAFLA